MKRTWMRRIALVMCFALILSVCDTDMAVSAATKKTISVTKVKITKPSTSTLTLTKGKTYTIKSVVSPANATNKKVTYTTSNKKVATVTSAGKITAVAAGKAKITVKATDKSGKSASITVTVVNPVVKVTAVTLNKTSLKLEIGKAYALKATVKPSTATNKKVSFTSSNTKVATVTSAGKVTAKAAGTAKITVKALDGSKKLAVCTVTVVKPAVKVAAVTLNKGALTLHRGTTYALKATVKPATATNKSVTYTSSNTKVATVTSTGKVTALTTGTATITAKALDGSGKSATCKVTVTEYKLTFIDDFDGTELNEEYWNYEKHQPGWVNNELQEYTDSKDNIYVKDGNLVIKANKETRTTEDGQQYDWYTSGKVTTAGKKDFRFGKFEIRAKSVAGQGLWPALWMMPRNENFYGQWPRCGEIDIMEQLGNEPNKTYSTIHYGNPHKEQQGTYVLENGSFADDYHVYGLEWEPSEMRFYVDGILIKTVNDWYTATEGKGEVTYPAPFDQFFHLQFNMAVGGNWPGNPDETTNFDNAKFMIDYVKVYQKDSYDDNVSKPEKDPVVFRNPDADGNYIVNGNFTDSSDDLNDDIAWGQKRAGGGEFEASMEDEQLVIRTEKEGSVDYAVQIVQPDLPMQKGGKYRLSFDAYADAERQMIVDISGPDNGYIRYFDDTKVELTTEKQHLEYEFVMKQDSDANGRLEFNLGNQNSVATVYISNVRLVKIGQEDVKEPEKTMLADGNYVYNGEFQEGKDRMANWEVVKPEIATVSVTNEGDYARELRVAAPELSSLQDVLVKQNIAITPNKDYVLTFDAYANVEREIEVSLNGQTYRFNLTEKKQQFKQKISAVKDITDKNLIFALGGAGVVYLDNVRLAEDALLINGDFISDFKGWTPFVDSGIASSVTYTVDSQNGNDQVAAFEINNTGDADWKIQLMQDGITLEKGKWYELTFDAKTDKLDGREISVALQHNGSEDGNWISYSGSRIASLSKNYNKYSIKFQMQSETDEKARLSFNMGAVGDKVITQLHNVYIDNVTLEETEPEIEVPVEPENMVSKAERWLEDIK